MNAVAQTNPKLPEFLMALAASSVISSSSFLGGLSVGQAHPKLSIKGRNFALVSSDGERVTHQQLSIPVVFVAANPGMSKAFYLKKFDPNAGENVPPDCYSNDGITPSDQSAQKQSDRCATCPHNAWGSKVSDTGSKGKACADTKRVAVLVLDPPVTEGGPYTLKSEEVHELRLPPTSFSAFVNFVKLMGQHRVPVEGTVCRLSFSDGVAHPQLEFTPEGFITENLAAPIMEAAKSEATKLCIGTSDTERQVEQAAPAQQPMPSPQGTLQQVGVPLEAPAPVVNGVRPIQAQPLPQAEVKPVTAKPKPAKVDKPKFLDGGLDHTAPVPQAAAPAQTMFSQNEAPQATFAQPVATNPELDELLNGLDLGE